MPTSGPYPWVKGVDEPKDSHELLNPAFQALVLPEERRKVETFSPGVLVYSRELGNLYLHDGVHPGGRLLTECGSSGEGPFRVFELDDQPVEDFLIPGDVWLQPADSSSGSGHANFKQYYDDGVEHYILRFWTGSKWLRPEDVPDPATDTTRIQPPKLLGWSPHKRLIEGEFLSQADPDRDELRPPQVLYIKPMRFAGEASTPYGHAVTRHFPKYDWDPFEYREEDTGVVTPETGVEDTKWPNNFRLRYSAIAQPADETKHKVRAPFMVWAGGPRSVGGEAMLWQSGVGYDKGALVIYDGALWQAGPIGAPAGAEPKDEHWWWNRELWTEEALENFDSGYTGPWEENRIYAPSQYAEHNGSMWEAGPNGVGAGYEPSHDSDLWEWVEDLEE